VPYVNRADLGGLTGFGAIRNEEDGGIFHADWEARVLALTVAMGASGCWNLDMSRSARETLPDYRRLSYYEIWLGALEKLLKEKGLVSAAELASARMLSPPIAIPRILRAAEVSAVLAKGAAAVRNCARAARFCCGDRVRTAAQGSAHHTRLPAYLRGKAGVIERIHGTHVFPDSNAQGLGENPQWLYSVAFAARELWGPGADAGQQVSFDAFEPYLEHE
jgi:nitrile hydratase subunit beta